MQRPVSAAVLTAARPALGAAVFAILCFAGPTAASGAPESASQAADGKRRLGDVSGNERSHFDAGDNFIPDNDQPMPLSLAENGQSSWVGNCVGQVRGQMPFWLMVLFHGIKTVVNYWVVPNHHLNIPIWAKVLKQIFGLFLVVLAANDVREAILGAKTLFFSSYVFLFIVGAISCSLCWMAPCCAILIPALVPALLLSGAEFLFLSKYADPGFADTCACEVLKWSGSMVLANMGVAIYIWLADHDPDPNEDEGTIYSNGCWKIILNIIPTTYQFLTLLLVAPVLVTLIMFLIPAAFIFWPALIGFAVIMVGWVLLMKKLSECFTDQQVLDEAAKKQSLTARLLEKIPCHEEHIETKEQLAKKTDVIRAHKFVLQFSIVPVTAMIAFFAEAYCRKMYGGQGWWDSMHSTLFERKLVPYLATLTSFDGDTWLNLIEDTF